MWLKPNQLCDLGHVTLSCWASTPLLKYGSVSKQGPPGAPQWRAGGRPDPAQGGPDSEAVRDDPVSNTGNSNIPLPSSFNGTNKLMLPFVTTSVLCRLPLPWPQREHWIPPNCSSLASPALEMAPLFTQFLPLKTHGCPWRPTATRTNLASGAKVYLRLAKELVL